MSSSDSAKTELNLGGGVAEINTILELKRPGRCWLTKDSRVIFRKRKEGWTVFSFSDLIRKAFEEYGLIHQQDGTHISYEFTYCPSLKAARQAVRDVSLEAGLNIDSRLTKGKHASPKIGDLPLVIMKEEARWRVCSISVDLSPSLQKHFNSAEEFLDSWESTDIGSTHYPTRKAAHQAVINWLSQTITKGK